MINATQMGRKTRYAYNQSFDISDVLRFDGLIKYDTQSQNSQYYNYGKGVYGSEAPFIPKDNPGSEDDGYVITFVTDEAAGISKVLIFDAKQIDSGPLATIELPQRVPLGFHACWVPGSKMS